MITPLSVAEVLSAVAQIGTAIAIAAGVWVAHSQLSAWRVERKAVRRAELAEELIALAYSLKDSFQSVRSPLQSLSLEDAQSPTGGFEKRLKRLFDANEQFQRLRALQVRVRAVIGDGDVDAAIDQLFDARAEVAVALEEAIDLKGEDVGPARERMVELRRVFSGNFTDRDALGQVILQAVKRIDRSMVRHARLDGS